MKILHVVEAFGGGVFEFVVALANHQAEDSRNQVTIAYSLRPETPVEFSSRFANSIELVPMGLVRSINLKKDFLAARNLARLYRKLQPNLVHLHSSKAGAVGRAAAWWAGQKGVIYTPHGFSFLMGGAGKQTRAIFRLVERAATWFGGLVVGCSESEGRLALELTSRATYVSNAIDVQAVSQHTPPSRVMNPAGPIIVAISGRIAEQRNPAAFCEVAARLTKKLPGQFRFVWIGGGDTTLIPPASPVEVTGWLPRELSLKALAESDIYFHPSLWEGLPLAILEAMALSLPVVTSDIPGNRETVVHGETGFVADSASAWETALIRLSQSRELRQELGAKGLARVSSEFSIEQMLARYDELYKSVSYTNIDRKVLV
jgi:glycosyltransferase involved in cell wall biosynthesis